nr:hypothetical protein [uncultured Carboxylicivirga sp.]
MIEFLTFEDDLLRKLLGFSDKQFDFDTYLNCFEKESWKPDLSAGYEYGFSVNIGNDWYLKVDPIGNDINCLIFPYCYWDSYNEDINSNEWGKENKSFDSIFNSIVQDSMKILGEPQNNWTDQDIEKKQAVIWQGKTGFIVVQKCMFDSQFGLEQNIWIQSGNFIDYKFNTPFIDSLSRISQEKHDMYGFPERE